MEVETPAVTPTAMVALDTRPVWLQDLTRNLDSNLSKPTVKITLVAIRSILLTGSLLLEKIPLFRDKKYRVFIETWQTIDKVARELFIDPLYIFRRD